MIWYHLYNLKNVKNIYGGVLLLVKLQALACTLCMSQTLNYCISIAIYLLRLFLLAKIAGNCPEYGDTCLEKGT